jgi:hypothetical protein
VMVVCLTASMMYSDCSYIFEKCYDLTECHGNHLVHAEVILLKKVAKESGYYHISLVFGAPCV